MKKGLVRVALALAAVAACTADTLPPKGQLMLVVTTNLAPPKDFDAFRIRIVQQGKSEPAHDFEYAMTGSQAAKLPATLAVVAGEDPNQTVTVTVTASRAGIERVKREAVVRLPTTRIAALPLPVDGLCIDTPCPPDASGKLQTCIAGSCQTADVEVNDLPDFDSEAVFGRGGTCFDTLDCFASGRVVSTDPVACSIAKDGPDFNVAVVQPAKSDGVCAANACLIPLDRDPFSGAVVTGWRESGDRVLLPKALCERSLPVMVTTKCPTKNGPTCGGFGGDASLPLDGSIGDAGAPPNVPAGVSFLDGDPRQGFVKGTVVIRRAPDESAVTGYRLYWADGPNKKLDAIASFTKTGADIEHPLEGPMFAGASHLFAVSLSSATELDPHVETGPIDNFPRSSTINVENEVIDWPDVLIDAKNERLLVAGFDQRTTRLLPGLVRCKLDGSACEYKDISNGAPAGQTSTKSGAVLDQVNDKVLVVLDEGSPTNKPRLFRCNLDGLGCDPAKDLGGPPGGNNPAAINRVPVVVDDVNKKLVALFHVGTKGHIFRCDLDGNNCVYPSYGESMLGGADGDVVIDKANGKLLVVHSALPGSVPFLFRCELDGTSCAVKNLSNGNPSAASDVSIAIDEVNQKLLVVTSLVNRATFYLYRCNLEGEACVVTPLSDPVISQAPQGPHLVVDAINAKMFVFGYGERMFYERCELDGTACASAFLTETFAWHPRGELHDGKLFAVGAGLTTGFGFATLSSY